MTDKPEPDAVPPAPARPTADHETVPARPTADHETVPLAPPNADVPSNVAGAPPNAADAPARPAETQAPLPVAAWPPPPGWTPPPGWVPVGYAAAPAGAVPPTPAGRRSWRPWPGWRRFLVPGLVGLILGGLLGSGITALATHDDGNRRVPVSRFGPGRDGFGPGSGNRGGNGFGPGNGFGSGNGVGPGNRGGLGNGGQNGTGPNGTPPNGNGGQTVPSPQPTTSG
jgi:hypothetical protein